MELFSRYKHWTGKIVLIAILVSELLGCSAQPNVRLFNYRSMDIPKEICEVSDSDVLLSLRMQLVEQGVLVGKTSGVIEEGDIVKLAITAEDTSESELIQITVGDEEYRDGFDAILLGKERGHQYQVNLAGIMYQVEVQQVYMQADTMTDSYATTYFDYTSAQDAFEKTKADIMKHRVFDYMYSCLLNNSMINGVTSKRDEFVERTLGDMSISAEEYGYSLDEYFENVLGLTIEEYREVLEVFYDEYTILEAFMIAEGQELSQNEYDKQIEILASEMEITLEELREEYREEAIRYTIYYDKCYDILLAYAKFE